MKVTNIIREFIVKEDAPFDSGHASTLLELKNGDILAAWFAGSWEKGCDVAIWAARRRQGVWEQPRLVCDERGVATWNPVLFRGQDNRILLFYKAGAAISEWKTYVAESRDEGETFSPPRELVAGDETGGRGPVKNKPIRLKDGTILAPASLEGNTWDAFADISVDDGVTWEAGSLVPLRRASYDSTMIHRAYNKHFCYGKGVIQPALWEDNEGGVHMLLRSTSSCIFRSDSADGGRTWSLAYDIGIPNNNSGLDLVKLPNGTVVLICNPRPNLPNYYKGPRTPLTVLYSTDNGNTFRELAVIEDGDGSFAYPAIICNDRNEIMLTYTWNRKNLCYCKLTYED